MTERMESGPKFSLVLLLGARIAAHSHPSSAKSSRHASNKKGSEMVATADTSVAAKNEEER